MTPVMEEYPNNVKNREPFSYQNFQVVADQMQHYSSMVLSKGPTWIGCEDNTLLSSILCMVTMLNMNSLKEKKVMLSRFFKTRMDFSTMVNILTQLILSFCYILIIYFHEDMQ